MAKKGGEKLVCVTGASGYIAVHLVEQLLAKGERLPVHLKSFHHHHHYPIIATISTTTTTSSVSI